VKSAVNALVEKVDARIICAELGVKCCIPPLKCFEIGTRMINKPIAIICSLLIAMLVYIYMPAEESSGKRRMGGAALVELEAVERVILTNTIPALGNAEANESVTITAQSTDRIAELYFDDGQLVTKGDKLIALAHGEEQALVEELKVNLKEQKRQLKRLQDLQKQSASAQSALDAQASLVEATSAKLEVAKIKLAEKFVYAPFTGVLGMREVSPGQLVTNSTDITTLDDVSQIKVEFSLPERYLNAVSKSQTVVASNVAYDEPFEGQVVSISPRVDKVTRAFTLRALFDNQAQQLKPGMLLQLQVQTEARSALVVPESSVIPMNDQHFVFVAEENKVRRVAIEIGTRRPGLVEVKSGLEPGTMVVSKGVMKLRDGASISVASTETIAQKG